MAEWRDPGTPERNRPWRYRGNEGWGSPPDDYEMRNAALRWGRNRENEGSQEEFPYEESYYEEVDSKMRMWFKIPGEKIGKVIGKRGRKVRELQDATNTFINIGREEIAGNVLVCILGTRESQNKCKAMIFDLISNSPNQSGRQVARAAGTTNNRAEARASRGDRFNEGHRNVTRGRRIAEKEKRKLARLAPFKKYFYVEAQEVAEMSEDYVDDLRKSLSNVEASFPFGGSGQIPNPVETFDQAFRFYPRLLSQLREHNFTRPFPIQSQGWPILLTGNDMIGIAQTGTGKTLTFLLPALIHIDGQDDPLSERQGPNVLIIAPTRELALQIDGEVKKFPYYGITSACLYGGGDREEQLKDLDQGVNIVIGTPGRLNDCYLAGTLRLETVTFVVLDEADHMLDLGFEHQIKKILMSVRQDRQTVMTSATWPRAIQNLAKKYMREPIKVKIGSRGLIAVHTVKQVVHVVEEEKKSDLLFEIIEEMSPNDKMIIFVGKRIDVDTLSSDLIFKGMYCQSIHGNRVQSDREQAIDDLRTGTVRILVATDVASRGLDIEDVTKVVNFDFPRNMEEYVHRVGRTGRAGKTGEAITFFTRENRSHATELVSVLEESGQVVPDELLEISFESEKIVKERSRAHRRPRRHRR